MAINRILLILISCLFFQTNCFSQDTIKIEKSIHYNSKRYPIRGKDFIAKLKYAREDIVFSDKHKRIEYCYYYDNERNCFGTDYILKNDSIIEIDGEIYYYKNQGDSILIERNFKGTYEVGFVKSLIPLETIGLFTTMTLDKVDTLWTTDYTTDKPTIPFKYPYYILHFSPVEGVIFNKEDVDRPPLRQNGDSLDTIFINSYNTCISAPYYFIKEMKFVVTKEGRIVNIKQSSGNLTLDYCPFYYLELIRYLKQMGKIEPAQKNGEPVNVQWVVKVVMVEENKHNSH